MSVGENIARFRKEKGWTQVELGEKLGVSNQAVSKWELGATMPDVMLLPILADTFGIYIDELFSREIKPEIHYDHCAEFPWPDDQTIRIFQAQGKKIIKSQEANTCIEVSFPKNCNETTRQYFKVEVFGNVITDGSINGDVICHGRLDCHEINGDINAQGDISAYLIHSCDKIICNNLKSRSHQQSIAEFPWPDDDIIRGVVFEGRKILQKEQLVDRFTFEVKGNAKQVKSECSIEVNGNVSGGCQAGNNVLVSGSISGGCACGADVVVTGSLSGGSNCGGEVTVGGNFSGGCNADGDVTCGGNFSGDINCNELTVGGDVESVKIKGDVVCNSLKCDNIEGDVTIVQKH